MTTACTAIAPAAHDYTSDSAPVQWYGGKGRMVARLAPLVPAGDVYVEPYGGAASMLFARPPAPCEVYNDLHGDLVNLFRALQCPSRFARLERRLRSTLYARAEFALALQTMNDSDADTDDRAWAFFVAQNQGFGGNAKTVGAWGRVFVSNRGMAERTAKWSGRLNALQRYHARMLRVQIDNRDALEVIRYWDSPETVFYVDPPYVSATRVGGNRDVYAHECDDAHHVALVDVLLSLQGRAVLSGYDSPLYAPLDDAGWRRVEFETACHAAGKVRGTKLRGAGTALEHAARTEMVWLSPGASAQGELFA